VIALCIGTAVLHIAIDKAWEAEVAHSTAAVPILIWATCVVGIILSVRFNDQVSRVIPGRFARNIGIATYPLYLINDVIGAIFLKGAYALTSHAEAALAFAKILDTHLFVIGGAKVYEAFLPHINRWLVTEVPLSVEGADTFMPKNFLDGFELYEIRQLDEDLRVKFYERSGRDFSL